MYFYIMSIREYLSSAKKSRYSYGKYSILIYFCILTLFKTMI